MSRAVENTGGTVSIEISTDTDFRALKKSLKAAARAAQIRVAQQLLADSRAFVPILSGQLLDSGRVEVIPAITDDEVDIVRVVYGSAIVEYAKIQHDVPFHHPSLGFFGPAQYLKKPYDLNKRYYYELYALEMQRALG